MRAVSKSKVLFLCLFFASVAIVGIVAWKNPWMTSSANTSAGMVIKVALEDHYPPMAFLDSEGHQAGFDLDIAQALCAELKAQCEYTIGSFDTLLARMSNGEFDMMVSGLAALEERTHTMDFTDPYYRSRTIYIGKAGMNISRDDLQGKRLGAQDASSQLDFLRQNWGDVAHIVPGSFAGIIDMLVQGQLDIVLADALVCYDFLKSPAGLQLEIIGDPLDISAVQSEARIGVRKGHIKLKASLNKAILTLRINGEYDRIMRKYFSFNIY